MKLPYARSGLFLDECVSLVSYHKLSQYAVILVDSDGKMGISFLV